MTTSGRDVSGKNSYDEGSIGSGEDGMGSNSGKASWLPDDEAAAAAVDEEALMTDLTSLLMASMCLRWSSMSCRDWLGIA